MLDMKNLCPTYFRSLTARTVLGVLAEIAVCLLTAISSDSAESSPDLSVRISRASVLYQNLMPAGATPAEAENAELWCIVNEMRQHGAAANVPALEKFIATHPDSPWVPSVHANLGRYCYEHGLYTRALQHWQAAWDATRTAENGPAKSVADFTFAYWTRLLGSLGRTEALRALFEETEGRHFDNGPLQQVVNATKEGYRMMLSDPGVCFKCGTFALNSVARTVKGSAFDTDQLLAVPSPKSGFSMTKLVELAEQSGLGLVPVKWNSEKGLIIPSVVHWKENHYAAILEEMNGSYLVMDPTFGKPRWLSADAIQEEASGFFLVPKEKINPGWKVLTTTDTDKIYGRGYVYDANDSNDGCGNGSGGGGPGGSGGGSGGGGGAGGLTGPGIQPGGGNYPVTGGATETASNAGSGSGGAGGSTGAPSGSCSSCGGGSGGGGGGGSCPPCGNSGGPGNQGGNAGGSGTAGAPKAVGAGMPVWRMSEPYISTWLYDRPLGAYEPGVGYPVDFMLAYKQRDTRTPSSSFFSFGNMWECSWLSYVTDNSPGITAMMACSAKLILREKGFGIG
jgi:uncharacterized membrane protein YgcG